MSTRMKVAFVCHLIAILIIAAFGVTYVFRSEFMPYNAATVGMSWHEVSPPFQILIISLMRAIGGACLAVAVLGLSVLFIPFRRGEFWARWSLPAGLLVIAAVTLYGMLYVIANTPATPPWIAPAVGAALVLVGLALSLGEKRPDSALSGAR